MCISTSLLLVLPLSSVLLPKLLLKSVTETLTDLYYCSSLAEVSEYMLGKKSVGP